LTGYAQTPRPDSFEKRFLPKTPHVQKNVDEVSRAFGCPPAWTLLSERTARRFPSWRSASFLYLRPSPLEEGTSPVFRGDDGELVPRYLLPARVREGLGFWLHSSRHHYWVWLHSADLEVPAYEQIATIDSGTATRGRKLCRSIERATGIPTYYFLLKYYSRVGDKDRPCPGCGRRWLLPGDGPSLSRYIQFLCRRYRLVSEEGRDLSSPGLARIGEYRGATRRKR